TRGCQFKTINSAVEAATEGSVVLVKEGIYDEGKIIIGKSISLIGEHFPVVEGDKASDIFFIDADRVAISGFEIRNTGISYIYDLSGIRINGRGHCRIENNRLNNTFFGIYLKYSDSCIIRNNVITGTAKQEASSGNAIHLWYSKNALITGNICKKHRDGIYFEFVENSLISENFSEGNVRYGLHFMFSNQDEYVHNTFRNNGAGVAVMFSRNITMIDNLFENNWGPSSYGLLLKDILDSEIENNRFIENTVGIFADGSNRIQMMGNEFRMNGWALKMLGSCMDNRVTGNNFISNTFDVITNTTTNYNKYEHNYWSEYTGYDLDKDGIGDIPYKPVKLFNMIVSNLPVSIILLRSPFVGIINFAEKVTPSLTPPSLSDNSPLMKMIVK
ncbi:MAG: nitrous oxide reductase family maturation protein NosD, partial [Bacteroidetes bacterium]|nr:nitrous oxide reductase family maturation protein NosD [Bacteroidota bacterium]